ncbi:MAG: MBL fold metallo-hydrolase, partial [Bacteroidota bacterium]
MVPDWIHRTDIGFYCTPGEFHIDPYKSSVQKAVVSHAHADHYSGGLHEVHGQKFTVQLAEARYGSWAGNKIRRHEFGQTFKIGPVEVTFYPAGHMLGSSQILLSYAGQHVLYSGDFALGTHSACTPLAYPDVQPDLLICESTFGEKASHPDPEAEMRRVLAAARSRPIMIGTYVLGKAQRITQLINACAPDMPILLHKDILRFHRVYEAAGRPLLNHQIYRRQFLKKHRGQFAYLLPPRLLSSYNRDHTYYKVFASGWDRKREIPHLDDLLD